MTAVAAPAVAIAAGPGATTGPAAQAGREGDTPVAAADVPAEGRTADTAIATRSSAPLDTIGEAPALPADVAAAPAPVKADDNRRIARIVTNGAWSWYMDPRVLRTSSQTYFGSVTNGGHIQVTAVRNSDGRLTHKTLTKLIADDHVAPALTRTPEGRVIAVWAGHGTASPPRYRLTNTSGNVSSFGATRSLSGSGLEKAPTTYGQIIQLSNATHRYWYFTRRNSDRAWVVTRSNDLVKWTKALPLWMPPGPISVARTPYPKFATDGRSRIDFAVTNTPENGGMKTSVYHFTYDRGYFMTSTGRKIRSIGGLGRVGPMRVTHGTKIYDGASVDGVARMYDLALMGTKPVVVITTRADTTYAYKWARWNGKRWVLRTLRRNTDLLGQPGGITFDRTDPGTVYLVRDQQATGQRELEEWATTDLGRTWVTRGLTAASSEANRTPATPHGDAGGGISVAWMNGRYDTFKDGLFWTQIWAETSSHRPVSLNASWSSGWSRGGSVAVTARQGVRGVGASQVRVAAAIKTPGRRTYSVVARGWTAADGRVNLRLPRVGKGTRVKVYTYKANDWGYATTASVTAPR
ncbi:BNR-4 repeat-containing protein [Kribbia dieselivorans]|uniref:BNR-4 repeat-containing protein n=1 Tax=Kribbia dieselivorans TaxID=331526 RepID=UPI00147081E8|nr:BNR-4 repeat-containing protein [Kribbia dieselivorans]